MTRKSPGLCPESGTQPINEGLAHATVTLKTGQTISENGGLGAQVLPCYALPSWKHRAGVNIMLTALMPLHPVGIHGGGGGTFIR